MCTWRAVQVPKRMHAFLCATIIPIIELRQITAVTPILQSGMRARLASLSIVVAKRNFTILSNCLIARPNILFRISDL